MSAQISIDHLSQIFENLQIKCENLQLQSYSEEPVLVQKNPNILSDMLKAINFQEYSTWASTDFTNKVFHLTELEAHTFEYRKVQALFDNTMKKSYKVNQINRVENPYLLIQYNLRKMKKRCSERELFHGTMESSVEPICKENFNWRLTGTSVGHKFGRGISFSPESTYSSYYPRNYYASQRIMFVVDVLIKSSCIGNTFMTIPPGSSDTSIKPDGKVIVKYEDNDFCPKYVIYYS